LKNISSRFSMERDWMINKLTSMISV